MSDDKTVKLFQLEETLKPYKQVLGKAADAVLNENVSKYPIFVVHQQLVEVGIPIINDEKTKWSIHISSLEEFVTKNLVATEKIDDFKKIYKNPEVFLCLFVLSDIGATFIFLPRN